MTNNDKLIEAISNLKANQESFSSTMLATKQEMFKRIEDSQREINQRLSNITELITGNGSPEKGIIIRLDRIEQNENRRTWQQRTTIAACIGAICSALAALFK